MKDSQGRKLTEKQIAFRKRSFNSGQSRKKQSKKSEKSSNA